MRTHIATVERPIFTGAPSSFGLLLPSAMDTTFQLVSSMAIYIVERKKLRRKPVSEPTASRMRRLHNVEVRVIVRRPPLLVVIVVCSRRARLRIVVREVRVVKR